MTLYDTRGKGTANKGAIAKKEAVGKATGSYL